MATPRQGPIRKFSSLSFLAVADFFWTRSCGTAMKALKLANPASWISTDYLHRQAENPELTDAQVLQLHGCGLPTDLDLTRGMGCVRYRAHAAGRRETCARLRW